MCVFKMDGSWCSAVSMMTGDQSYISGALFHDIKTFFDDFQLLL